MDYITVLNKIDFPKEGIKPIIDTYEILEETVEFKKSVEFAKINRVGDTHTLMQTAAEKYNVSFHISLVCVLLSVVDNCIAYYKSKNIPEEFFWDSLKDITFKTYVCKKIYGVYGTNWYPWQLSLMYAERIKIGRLQYEWKEFSAETVTVDGITFEKGKKYVNCHIPEDGALSSEALDKSFNKAAKFFGYMDIAPFTCTSWLLYSKYQGCCFAENTNVYNFVKRFTLVEDIVENDFGDYWRVFYNTYGIGNLKELPEDTSLQRNFKKYIKNGGTFGESVGVLVWKIQN